MFHVRHLKNDQTNLDKSGQKVAQGTKIPDRRFPVNLMVFFQWVGLQQLYELQSAIKMLKIFCH